jgi:elongation factor P
VELQVTYTEPAVAGNTATNTLKPATVETGAQVMVPLFINEGEIIRVDTASGNYIERVK